MLSASVRLKTTYDGYHIVAAYDQAQRSLQPFLEIIHPAYTPESVRAVFNAKLMLPDLSTLRADGITLLPELMKRRGRPRSKRYKSAAIEGGGNRYRSRTLSSLALQKREIEMFEERHQEMLREQLLHAPELQREQQEQHQQRERSDDLVDDEELMAQYVPHRNEERSQGQGAQYVRTELDSPDQQEKLRFSQIRDQRH